MTSDDEWQVELSNGRAVYLKPAEHGAPQARASLMSLMMTLIACLIRAEQGAPQARDALRSHLAVCAPRRTTSHLHTSHLHTTPHRSSRSPRRPPPPSPALHTFPFTDAPLIHTGRPLVDPSAHSTKEDHLLGARFGARASPHLRNLAHLRPRALPRWPQRAARARRDERRDGARRRGRADALSTVRPPLIAI